MCDASKRLLNVICQKPIKTKTKSQLLTKICLSYTIFCLLVTLVGQEAFVWFILMYKQNFLIDKGARA